MSILIDRRTRVVVQGITGRDGSFHTRQMMSYGTKVVAGVTPGKGGEDFDGVPIFNTVAEAITVTRANTAVIYVPVAFAVDAIFEAADAGIALIVCITEGVPTTDMLRVYSYLQSRGTRLVGPNCPGLITPGVCKVGIMPGPIVKPGKVGVISRSGTLTYEVVHNLTLKNIGQSTCIGIGGDPIIGTNFIDCLEMFEKDKGTSAVVLIGEIGGTDEEEAAQYIKKHMTKPVVGFIAGRTAPPGKRMGHAGAIISGGSGTAAEKIRAFRAIGVEVAETPAEVAEIMEAELKKVAAKKSAAKTAKSRVVLIPRNKAVRKVAKSPSGRKTAKKASAKTIGRKKATPKKTTRKKATAKKTTRKKATSKKIVRKPARKKTASRKAAPKTTGRKKTAPKKTTRQKATGKKTVRKPARKKTAARKTTGKRVTRKKSTKVKSPAGRKPGARKKVTSKKKTAGKKKEK